jgi:hypothetical protein
MKTMPSSEFRVKYANLTEPTVVTVMGHEIGEWIPYRGQRAESPPAARGFGEPRPAPKQRKAR